MGFRGLITQLFYAKFTKILLHFFQITTQQDSTFFFLFRRVFVRASS